MSDPAPFPLLPQDARDDLGAAQAALAAAAAGDEAKAAQVQVGRRLPALDLQPRSAALADLLARRAHTDLVIWYSYHAQCYTCHS